MTEATAAELWIEPSQNDSCGALCGHRSAHLVLLGYKRERGAVPAFQRAAGFNGRDLDDIPGARTRAAMHGELKAAEPLAFKPAAPPADLLREIGEIRNLVAEAGRHLDALAELTVA